MRDPLQRQHMRPWMWAVTWPPPSSIWSIWSMWSISSTWSMWWRSPASIRRGSVFALALASLCVLRPSASHAQADGVDLNVLALDWARGVFGSPLVCVIDGKPTRGLRRILVKPGPRDAHPAVGQLLIVKLDAANATRCFTELESSVPNIAGQLTFRLPGRSRPDSARRDFSAQLRREKGFDFHIVEGKLSVKGVGDEADAARRIDLRGGTARLHQLDVGSDLARLVADIPSPRKLLLEIEPRKGEPLRFPLVMMDLR